MIQKGADKYNDGLTRACLNGHLDIIKLMLQKGADNYNNGLDRARQGGHINIIKLMLEKGANPLSEYEIPFKIPKDDSIIEIIYESLYDYMPDEMIDIVLKYSTVEDFNVREWLHHS